MPPSVQKHNRAIRHTRKPRKVSGLRTSAILTRQTKSSNPLLRATQTRCAFQPPPFFHGQRQQQLVSMSCTFFVSSRLWISSLTTVASNPSFERSLRPGYSPRRVAHDAGRGVVEQHAFQPAVRRFGPVAHDYHAGMLRESHPNTTAVDADSPTSLRSPYSEAHSEKASRRRRLTRPPSPPSRDWGWRQIRCPGGPGQLRSEP